MEEGIALLQLYPKEFLPFLGLVGKGAPLPIMCHPEEQSDEGSPPFNRGCEMTLLQLHPKTTLCLWGKGGDPSQKAFGTSLLVGSEVGLCPLSIVCQPRTQ